MPCMDGGPSQEQIEREERFHVAQARLACDRCKDLISRGEPIPDWATEWWVVHQADDAAREKDERIQKQQTQVREKALSKLSSSEKRVLGLD